ncbi:hypothetical protein O5D80_008636 [Batrachochytrium dendrobatidis]|nr:hypothetical protein O5D80_008636 [Batrachochytrium dendrobatidis]
MACISTYWMGEWSTNLRSGWPEAPTSKASQQINFLLAYPTSLVNQYFGFTIKLRTPTIDHLTSTYLRAYE